MSIMSNFERPLRVAQLIGTFGGGGAQRQAAALVESLAVRGHHSMGIAVRSVGPFAESSAHRSAFVSLGASQRSLLGAAPALARLRAIVRRERFDVIHVHGSFSLPLAISATMWQSVRSKVVFIWQDSGIVHAGKLPPVPQRLAIRRASGLLGSSHAVSAWLQGLAPRSQVGVFHGGVPEVRPCSSSEIPTIVWLGRWVSGKAPHLLLEAAATLRSEGHRFRAVMAGPVPRGRESFLKMLRDQVKEMGLEHVVEMPGELGDQQLDILLDGSQIAVQTSHSEGLSMALLEQMMRGHAIVATDVGDTRVALADGDCGLLTRPGDAGSLADALRVVIADRVQREALGARARQRAIAEYSLDAMARKAEFVYRSMLAGGGAALNRRAA